MNSTYSFPNILDNEIRDCINSEALRQSNQINLIASENFASDEVLHAQGSILTNKYAEGYPGRRYYSGCVNVDSVERIACERAKKLFGASYVNVQPHSGSQANQAAFLALLKRADKILGMSMESGGHLTHGSRVNLSGKWFETYSYNVDRKNYCLNYDEIEEIAQKCRPTMIIAGFSSYTKEIDFSKFRKIADKVGAFLLADISHISGIIAAKLHDSPLPHADVVTSTTHKTLRGPRGGMMMTNNPDIAKKIDSALFPGIQGGPFMHIIAAKAVAFLEALQPSFVDYIKQVLRNARVLSDVFESRSYSTLGGTQNHISLLDLRKDNLTGAQVADFLEFVGITVNKNVVPFDIVSPRITSGIRIGSPFCTTMGMKEEHFKKIGDLICDILGSMKEGTHQKEEFVFNCRQRVKSILEATIKQNAY